MKRLISILISAVFAAVCWCALSVSAAASTQLNHSQNNCSLCTGAVQDVDTAAYRLRGDANESKETASVEQSTQSDGSIQNSDGINTVAAGIWIGVIASVLFVVILALVIVLAKRNHPKARQTKQ